MDKEELFIYVENTKYWLTIIDFTIQQVTADNNIGSERLRQRLNIHLYRNYNILYNKVVLKKLITDYLIIYNELIKLRDKSRDRIL